MEFPLLMSMWRENAIDTINHVLIWNFILRSEIL